MTRIGFMAATLMLSGVAAADGGKLDLAVSGVIPSESTVYVSLCTEAEFMQTTCALKAMHKADAETLIFSFENVAPGRYAAAAWWDADNNGEMDSGAYGEPLEPVAVSNGAVGTMGPPLFADAAFDVPADAPVALKFE